MYKKFLVPPNKFPKYPEGLHKLIGPFDIALIKMKVGVTLVPGRLVPVGEIVKFPFSSWSTPVACALCRLALAASRTKECQA